MGRRLHFSIGMQINGNETASSAQTYDVVILGGGTGSTVAAWTFASQGQSVAVIERKYIGGSCPNIACLPSKNILQSARVASYFRRGQEFGLFVVGERHQPSSVRSDAQAAAKSCGVRPSAEFMSQRPNGGAPSGKPPPKPEPSVY